MDTKHRVMTACYGATSSQFTDEELADLFIHTPYDLLHDAHVWEYYAKDLWDDLPQYTPPKHHADTQTAEITFTTEKEATDYIAKYPDISGL